MNEATERWIGEAKRRRILWVHSLDPVEKHPVLPDGKHATALFDKVVATGDPVFLQTGGMLLAMALIEVGLDIMEPTRVLGVGKRSAALAHIMAQQLTIRRPGGGDFKRCLSDSLEEPWIQGERRSAPRASQVRHGERVLLVSAAFDHVLAETAIEAVRAVGAWPVKQIGTLANLSGEKRVMMGLTNPNPIITLIDCDARPQLPHECILCRTGSEALPLSEFVTKAKGLVAQ